MSSSAKIILFGGYARAEYKVGSDIDLLVITEDEVPRDVRGELCSRFEEDNSDLLFYTSDVFEKSETLLVKKIKEDGVLIWKN